MNDFRRRDKVGRIPVTVVGGYLGAGKTTLLNRLLAEPQGTRLAVVVNDFGSVNIDAALIASREGETIALTNGCVCCSIADNLALTLHDLAERPDDLDHVIIEASGVADPGKIASYAGSHPRLGLDSVIVVADAETVRARADDKYVGDVVRHQLAAADVIVLSKTDLIDDARRQEVRHWIETEVPGARILAAAESGLLAELVLAGAAASASAAHIAHPANSAHGHDHDRDYEHVELFATWTFSVDRPLDGAALRAAIAALPPAVVRAKGIVSLAEAPGRRFVLQLVGRRWSLEASNIEVNDQRAMPPDRSVIVCIGPARHLEPAALEALMAPLEAAPILRKSASEGGTGACSDTASWLGRSCLRCSVAISAPARPRS